MDESTERHKKLPQSFVFTRGTVSPSVTSLMQNVRIIVQPYTAINLKAKRWNKFSDFIGLSGKLGVTHFLIFTTTKSGNVLWRLVRGPSGPSIQFNIVSYTLMSDLAKIIPSPKNRKSQAYMHPPVLLLKNFKGAKHLQLIRLAFQSLFPPINVRSIKLIDCRRILLLYYDSETDLIHLRHYFIDLAPISMNPGIENVLESGSIPDLSQYSDISEYVLEQIDQQAQDDESEEIQKSESKIGVVHVSQKVVGRVNKAFNDSLMPELKSVAPSNRIKRAQIQKKRLKSGKIGPISATEKRKIRLIETGPRISLQVAQIHSGLKNEGKALYSNSKSIN